MCLSLLAATLARPTIFLGPRDQTRLIARNVYRALALAVKCEGLVGSGAIPDYAELAR